MSRYYYFCTKYATNVLRSLINRIENRRIRITRKNRTKFKEMSKK